MRDDIIHRQPRFVQFFGAFRHFQRGRFFLPPPVARGDPHIFVNAFPTAEGKETVALDLKDLSAHQVDEVSFDTVYHAAVPVGFPRFIYRLQIVVRAVHKSGHKPTVCQKINDLSFGFVAAENIAEIPADDQHIPAFKFPEIFIVQTL